MKVILVATDFSKNGNNAVEYAAAIANEFHSRLLLTNVHETFIKDYHTEENGIVEEIRVEAEQKLILLQNKIESKFKNVKCELHVITGVTAADTLNKFANDQLVDLTVVGSTGTNKLERLLMGSTSSRLVHISKVPVICVPGDSAFEGIKKIVVATDLKEDNLNAALSVITFARHFDAEITFLFVDDEDLIHSEKSIEDITAKIRNHVHYPRMSGFISKDTVVTKGINNFLKNYKADILVMYSHFDESTSIRFSESVTSGMSDLSHVPLLALKKGVVSLAL